MIKEFKEFIMRGSVLDLAVGVVIGSAFTAIVTKVVEGLITPLVSLVFVLTTGKQSADDALGALVFPVKGVQFKIGDVISAIITFLITAFVLFLIVKAANKFKKKPEPEAAEATPTSEEYLEQIRDLLAAQNQAQATIKHEQVPKEPKL
ncbi:large conductance mechanosensitive channel protein MscL [Enterococcus sp. UD-01]|jgi:large conductance mechanosensitive channel|uniref:large conductance mechanosensitive channel protein MscL n=1 Tax=Enterococcus sp. UD-01 TaxID=3373911 RepID=UPI0038386D35